MGPGEEPTFHQFESPRLRLHLDEGYHILVEDGQEAYLDAHPEIAADGIGIHRFYDASATSWSARPKEFRLEDAATDPLRLIEKLKAKSGAPRVHLVAHSMGGLVCRCLLPAACCLLPAACCLLQKILPDRGTDPTEHVDKLFTYGTLHGGITFDVGFGVLEQLRDTFGIQGGDIFGPRRMYAFLTPDAERRGPRHDHGPRAAGPPAHRRGPAAGRWVTERPAAPRRAHEHPPLGDALAVRAGSARPHHPPRTPATGGSLHPPKSSEQKWSSKEVTGD
ncbi:esterase/lipase family protein [Streptomyces pharetrae]|uniref:esterase/lipase family protein n=1 Tax=Streptomyces pharetrae TaxID=291370 RepID=UPI0036C766D1